MIKSYFLYFLLLFISFHGFAQTRTQTTLDYQNRIHPEISNGFMVVSQNSHATEAGYEILKLSLIHI